MAIETLKDDLNIIAGLGDNPNADNNLTAQELKGKFDAAALLIQQYLNKVIVPAINGYILDGTAFAPAGYGLGGTAVSIDSLDNAKSFGLFRSNQGTPSDQYWNCLAMPDASGNVAQLSFRCVAAQVFYATRCFTDNSWEEWEFVNPFMAVGTEYKTTEKYKGFPVYKKLVEYTNPETIGSDGTMTNIRIGHGISNFGELVKITGKQNGEMLPYFTASGKFAMASTVTSANIFVDTNSAWTSRTWQFEVAYTKTV